MTHRPSTYVVGAQASDLIPKNITLHNGGKVEGWAEETKQGKWGENQHWFKQQYTVQQIMCLICWFSGAGRLPVPELMYVKVLGIFQKKKNWTDEVNVQA